MSTPFKGSAEDVIELILGDHRRIRRLRTRLSEAARYGGDPHCHWMFTDLWLRLAYLLELHFAAEEEICGSAMHGVSTRTAAQVGEAVADHDDIREALLEARFYPVGSAAWWGPAHAVLTLSAAHLDQEENGALAASHRAWSDGQRRQLGRQWSAFVAARIQDGASASGQLKTGRQAHTSRMPRSACRPSG